LYLQKENNRRIIMFFRSHLNQSKKSLLALGSILTAAVLVLSACSPQAAPATTAAPVVQATTAPTTAPTSGLPETGAAVVTTASNPTYGDILTDSKGMTLYLWKKDTTPGKSNCSGDCAVNWPPLTVASSTEAAAGTDVSGTLATITRDDGSIQVTINGMPLYYFKGDAAPGDANGQGIGETWYVVDAAGNMITTGSSASSGVQSTQPAATKDTSGSDDPGYGSDYPSATKEATKVSGSSDDSVRSEVMVSDQAVISGTVTIGSVSDEDQGWLVIHIDNGGKPGEVIGIAPVYAGANTDVVVPIDVTKATPTLYAMLHKDEGVMGLYEFPGEDKPVTVSDQMVNVGFKVTGSLPEQNTPAVVPLDQPISNNQVNVPSVISSGAGWVVIHLDDNGKPGAVTGHAAVKEGLNLNVKVDIDAANSGSGLIAMLHTDAGTAGTYEFPGADAPVKVGSAIVMLPFKVLPATTGSGSDDGTADQGSGDAGSAGAAVTIADSRFNDDTLTVKVGTTVTWTNNGNFPHTVTADDGSFDSSTLGSGETFSFTFSKAGTYAYYCKLHGKPGGQGMSGEIIVTP
jgi:predicted lipoprotein with Yx(FWY)xxD motif/plastocyanin